MFLPYFEPTQKHSDGVVVGFVYRAGAGRAYNEPAGPR